MAISLFGWLLPKQATEPTQRESFAPPVQDDGASIVQATAFGGAYGTFLDIGGGTVKEAEMISRYRQMAQHPEIATAIEDIVNEAMVTDEEEETVKIDLDKLDKIAPPNVQQALQDEFSNILRLLEFNVNGYEIFSKWYIDGRINYHAIIDRKRPMDGIQELRYIDPRNIKKVREVFKKKAEGQGEFIVQKTFVEYFLYSETGFDNRPTAGQSVSTVQQAVKIAKDAIVYVTSGQLDELGQTVISFLHKAIRPLNMLRTMEDSAVIYRLVRAPERRVWYIDVGSLQKGKAEQYVQNMMTKYRNKLVYDASSGAVSDQRKHMTMLEDIWLTRREGGRGTEIDTLPGGENLGQMEEVNYFLRKLYKSLHVPVSRLDPEMTVTLGQATEITRDEIRYGRFIDRLRTRFSELFLEILRKQVILKGIMGPDDWESIRHELKFIYAKDNDYQEQKELNILTQRGMVLQGIQPFIGRHISNKYVRQNIWRQTEEDMKEMDEEIMEERENPIYMVQTNFDGSPVLPITDPGMVMPPLPPPPEVMNSMYPDKTKTTK